MITLFTCPKAFTDPHVCATQERAIRSWQALRPMPEIVVLGDDAGVADAACRLEVRHVPTLQRNEYGTPFIQSIFREATAAASNPVMGFINADIALGQDFVEGVAAVVRRAETGLWHWLSPAFREGFLLVGHRFNVDVGGLLGGKDDSIEQYINELRPLAGQGIDQAIDYFVFPRGLFVDFPPFAVGRPAWDNWFLSEACRRGLPLVDATAAIMALHQDHDYAHTGLASREAVWESPESRAAFEIASYRLFDLRDCRYRLTRDLRVVADRSYAGARRRAEQWRFMKPQLWRMLGSWKIRMAVARACPWL